MKHLVSLSMLAVLALACGPAEQPAEPPPAPAPAAQVEPEPEPAPPTAVAVLRNAEGVEVGKATFTQNGDVVTLTAEVRDVERDGPHGFHVHEVGECVAPDFTSAGGHFNPKGTEHACPPTAERHAGDFGNIETDEGAGYLEVSSELVTVTPGETSVVGRAVLLHEGTDDCVAQPTGAAGPRLACGVVKLQLFDAEDQAAEAEGGEGGEGGE